MNYRGKNYEDSIKELKALNKADKPTYKLLLKSVMEKFNISYQTIRRDINKKVPGLRKVRSDAGKNKTRITKSEILIAEEIMKSGKTKKELKEVLELKTGKAVSERKVGKVIKRSADSLPDRQAGVQTVEGSMFGNEAKKFFEKIFEIDLIAPEKGIALKHGSVSFIVKKEDLNDIILILTNAYNRFVFSTEQKMKTSREEIRTAMMQHLIEDQMRLARESSDYKLVESLTRMIDRTKEDAKLPDDFETVLKVCRELKPDINHTELIGLIKKVSNN